MRRLLLIAMVSVAALASCRKDNNNDTLTGTYTGTFLRFGPAVDGIPTNVTITFTGNEFSGQGQFPTYPALCNGTFNVEGGKVTFENACVWTANFDWTFILDGEYDITINDDNITISRQYGTYQDEYKLTRQH